MDKRNRNLLILLVSVITLLFLSPILVWGGLAITDLLMTPFNPNNPAYIEYGLEEIREIKEFNHLYPESQNEIIKPMAFGGLVWASKAILLERYTIEMHLDVNKIKNKKGFKVVGEARYFVSRINIESDPWYSFPKENDPGNYSISGVASISPLVWETFYENEGDLESLGFRLDPGIPIENIRKIIKFKSNKASERNAEIAPLPLHPSPSY